MLDLKEKELKVQKIKNGTVIDHIAAGYALSVLRILGITGKEGITVSVVMNVPSEKLGKKDIVKVEGRELKKEEVNKIALVAPKATINIIRNYKIIRKDRIRLPNEIEGIISCINPKCITKGEREPIKPKFTVISDKPIRLRCKYCGTILEIDDIEKQL
ncbi:MAG: aspartate carbamoyltransferase regulatory subunit [archaeon GB-1867-097]|nr:aspartate carbamoyltransferase regulatory subunit [Candidatus Culexmicrobium thermophilum]MCS7384479.1 aspartate carbamoyltransferase regulatory subunit [Candidatus Culexmicrobium thermophilum]